MCAGVIHGWFRNENGIFKKGPEQTENRRI